MSTMMIRLCQSPVAPEMSAAISKIAIRGSMSRLAILNDTPPQTGHGEIGPEAFQPFGRFNIAQAARRGPETLQQSIPPLLPELPAACRDCFRRLRRHAGLLIAPVDYADDPVAAAGVK
jgi:hypothetical protein